MSPRVGVVLFPGSNCEQDVVEAVESLGATGTALWQSRTVVQTPGWLSIWGIGPNMNVNTTLKTTHTSLRQTTTGTSIGSGVQIFKNGGAHSFVRCLDSAWSAALAVLPPT